MATGSLGNSGSPDGLNLQEQVTLTGTLLESIESKWQWSTEDRYKAGMIIRRQRMEVPQEIRTLRAYHEVVCWQD